MADTVVKTVEDVDKLFSQIVVNGETYNSDRYVPTAPVQVIEEPESEPQQTEISQNPSVPSGQTIQGEDVYAVVLNDEQHNFVDPEEVSSRTEADTTLQGNINSINALIPSDTTTSNKLVNESGIQDAVDTAVENAVADLDVPAVGGNGKYIKAISETNGKISATEGTIADTVESGNNDPVTSDAVNSAIAGISGDVTQQISDAIGALDVASAGGSGKFIQSISETDGKINATEGTIDNVVTSGSTNPVTGGAVNTAIESAIASIYKPAGDKTVAQLTSALLVAGNLGNVYNITDSGTTTSDFVEGAGKPISAGDNVAIVDTGSQGSPSYKFDLLSGFIDLSNYIQKSQTSGLVKNDGTVDTTVYASQSSLSSYIQKSQTQGLVKNDGTIDTTAYAKQSEMSVTPGTGTDSDKTTIQLKTGTSATVLTQHIPAGSSTPVMDGTGSAGSSANYARADHVHPSDTSKQDVLTFDSVPTENSTNPVESGGIYTELQGKADTEDLTIPTDAVLHYSFDEVPDLPDGTAVERYDNNLTTDGWQTSTTYPVLLTENNGVLKITQEKTLSIIRKSYYTYANLSGRIFKARVYYHSDTEGACTLRVVGNNILNLITIPETDEWVDLCFIIGSASGDTSNQYIGFQFPSASANNYVLISQLYIGDGSYSTPVIDNANGQWNSIFQSGVTVSGVSGKGLKCFNGNQVNFGAFNLNNNFSVSLWVKPDSSSNSMLGDIVYKTNQFFIRNGASSGNDYIYTGVYNKNTSDWKYAITSSLLVANKYTHIVCTRNGTELKLYLDGVVVKTTTLDFTDINNNQNNMVVSRSANTRPQSYDDLLIFDRALSETEVQALYYNHGNTPKYYTYADYENEQLSQSKADKVTGATAGHLAALDSNGNLTDSGKSSTSSVTSGSTDLVESGAVADEIQNITDIASSLPTDAVLHYSFDEVPDLPDGTADVRLLDNNTYDLQSGNFKFLNNGGATFTNNNGNLNISVSSGSNRGAYISKTYLTNKIIKLKIKIIELTGFINVVDNGATLQEIHTTGIFDLTSYHTETAQYTDFYLLISNGTFTAEILKIYIGDGSYSTPIIDNTNGQNNAVNNGGIAVQGVSGKAVSLLGNGYIDGMLPWKPIDQKIFTMSCWVRNWDKTSNLSLFNDWAFYAICPFRVELSTTGTNKIMIDSIISASTIYRCTNTAFDFTSINKMHIIVIFAGADTKIYINGVEVQLTKTTATPNSNYVDIQLFQIGRARLQSGYNYSKADIDDFQIFDRALSETEVLALYYNHGNTPKYYTFADYQLNNGEVVKSVCSQLPDSSGNVALTKSDVGLGNVENTGDSAVPVQNGTTKFTTGGAFDFFGKSASAPSWLGKVFGRFMGRKWAYNANLNYDIASICYADGLWLVGTAFHGLWWSEDGKNWTQITTATNDSSFSSRAIKCIYYENGLYLAGASGGYNVYWSEDGKTWTKGTMTNPNNVQITGLVYANNLWLASSSDTTNGGLWWSEDGKNWTKITGVTESMAIYTPVYANGVWVTGGSKGLYKSSDGKNWTQILGDTTNIKVVYTPIFVDYAPGAPNGIWVAGSETDKLLWSTDLETWTPTASSIPSYVYTPVYVNGLWIAGSSVKLYWSENGRTWQDSTGGNSAQSASPVYNNGLWITHSSTKILWSENGKDWIETITNVATTRKVSPVYAKGIWLIGAVNGLWYSDIEMALEDLTD